MYLHLRLQDEAEAGALYRRVGFEPIDQDVWLVRLLGQEQRYLMRKRLLR